MARRTITLNDGVEKAIRKYQTVMMLSGNRDVTFTEALQMVLIRAFILSGQPSMATAWWKGESRQLVHADYAELLEGNTDMGLEGVLDLLPDGVADAARKELSG